MANTYQKEKNKMEFKTYTKIETIYNRSLEGKKKLIVGDYRNETVEYLKDNEWIGTEKIDGTNIRVFWDGYSVSFAGRTNKSVIRHSAKSITKARRNLL